MREIIVDLIFILGVITFIIFLCFLAFLILNKIYGLSINFKFKTTAKAIEYLAKNNIECEKICKMIDFIRKGKENERN